MRRVETAVQLYRQNTSRCLLFTGGCDESFIAARYARMVRFSIEA
jgi:hypothetical protein